MPDGPAPGSRHVLPARTLHGFAAHPLLVRVRTGRRVAARLRTGGEEEEERSANGATAAQGDGERGRATLAMARACTRAHRRRLPVLRAPPLLGTAHSVRGAPLVVAPALGGAVFRVVLRSLCRAQ